MTSIVKRLSIIAVIIAVAILVYGFIDAGSYRDGYKAGYDRISRAVDAACVNGLVADNGLCDAAEVALYADDDIIVGLAQVADSLGVAVSASVANPTSATNAKKTKIKKWRRKATSKTTAPVAATGKVAPSTAPSATVVEQESAVMPPVEQVPSAPIAPLDPLTLKLNEADIKLKARQQKAAAVDCSKKTERNSCIADFDPYCTWTTVCTDSTVKLNIMNRDAYCTVAGVNNLIGAHQFKTKDKLFDMCVDYTGVYSVRVIHKDS